MQRRCLVLVVLMLSVVVHTLVAALFVLASVHGPEAFVVTGLFYFVGAVVTTIVAYVKLRTTTKSGRTIRYLAICAAPLCLAIALYFAGWSSM
jgi:hypothetical protein